MIFDSLAELRAEIEEVAADGSLSPQARTARLQEFRGDLTELLGTIDTYVADNAIEAQADTPTPIDVARLRENADIRGELLARGQTTEEAADAAMLYSHEHLDELAEEGLLEETAFHVAAFMSKFEERKHPRGRGGRFSEVFGKVDKLKLGKTQQLRKGVSVTRKSDSEFHVHHEGKLVHKTAGARDAARVGIERENMPAPSAATKPSSETTSTKDWIRKGTGRKTTPEDLASAQKDVQQRASEKDLPDEEKTARYMTRRHELEQRATHAVASAAQRGKLSDAEAHFNDAGKVSQRTLANYVEEASTKPQTTDLYSQVDAATGQRVWDSSRRELHERIIGAYLKKRKVDETTGKSVLDYSPDAEDLQPHPDGPGVIFSGGGYAAGKGGVLKILAARGEMPPDAFTLDPDQIKAELPEFQSMIGTDPEANMHVYREAWAIAQEIQARAMDRKLNIVVDGISNTSPEEMGQRARAFTSRGYNARAVYVDIPTEEAMKRAQNRAVNAKEDSDRRMIPEIIMRSVHRDVAATVPSLPGYLDDHQIPLRLEVWDNDQGKDEQGGFRPPKPFFTYEGGKREVVDQALWDRFTQKGHETILHVDAPTAGA